MRSVNMAGFLTAEIRDMGSRTGFELHSLNGERRILAHVEIASQHRVSKYEVDTRGFDEFLTALGLLNPNVEIRNKQRNDARCSLSIMYLAACIIYFFRISNF